MDGAGHGTQALRAGGAPALRCSQQKGLEELSVSWDCEHSPHDCSPTGFHENALSRVCSADLQEWGDWIASWGILYHLASRTRGSQHMATVSQSRGAPLHCHQQHRRLQCPHSLRSPWSVSLLLSWLVSTLFVCVTSNTLTNMQ